MGWGGGVCIWAWKAGKDRAAEEWVEVVSVSMCVGVAETAWRSVGWQVYYAGWLCWCGVLPEEAPVDVQDILLRDADWGEAGVAQRLPPVDPSLVEDKRARWRGKTRTRLSVTHAAAVVTTATNTTTTTTTTATATAATTTDSTSNTSSLGSDVHLGVG